MVGQNKLIINEYQLIQIVSEYLEHIHFPASKVDYINTEKDGELDFHEIFMQSEDFGGIFSLNTNNEFMIKACQEYINNTINSSSNILSIKFSKFPTEYTVVMIGDSITTNTEGD